MRKKRIRTPLAHVSAVLYAAGRRARKTSGSALAATSGTRSTPEASAQLACTSGLRRSASLAADGRRIHSGTGSDSAKFAQCFSPADGREAGRGLSRMSFAFVNYWYFGACVRPPSMSKFDFSPRPGQR